MMLIVFGLLATAVIAAAIVAVIASGARAATF
jgi:hypothetical protein